MRARFVLLTGCCLLAAALSWGDTVTLNDGRVIEGEVTVRGDTVVVRTKAGISSEFKKSEVRHIEYRASPVQEFDRRRQALAPTDAKGRYELGLWAVENKLAKEAEAVLTEAAGMASSWLSKIKMALAGVVAERSPKRAIRMYQEAAEQFKVGDASLKALALRRDLAKRRREAYDAGVKEASEKKWDLAISDFRRAYHLTTDDDKEEKELTEAKVLKVLAETRARAEGALRDTTEAPNPNAILCSKCPGSLGWGACTRCKGTGQVATTIPAVITIRGIIPERQVMVECPTCRGGKQGRCGWCWGSMVNPDKVKAGQRICLHSLADSAFREGARDDVFAGLDAMAAATRRNHIDLPIGFKPPCGAAKPLRGMIRGVPFQKDTYAADQLSGIVGAYRKLVCQERANFLMGYAIEVLLGGDQPPAAMPVDDIDLPRNLNLALVRQTAPFVSATELTALPEENHGRWVRVPCTFKGLSEDPLGMRQQYTIATGEFHNIHPVAFTPKAKVRHAEIVKSGKAEPGLKAFCETYPYDQVPSAFARFKDGDELILIGRFVFREGVKPESTLEVWGADAKPDAETQRQLAAISRPVTFDFADTPVSDVAFMLGALTSTPIAVDLPEEAKVGLTGKCENQPLGPALASLLRAANLRWAFSEKGLKIVTDVSPQEAQRIDSVMGLLNKL